MNDVSTKVCEVIVAGAMVVVALSASVCAIALMIGTFYPIFTAAQIAAMHTGG